ncbi:MAG: L,D-transpeptidase family protein, partial [Planctomycetales bacterium]|nr:L,D-transpeptidase family protein [Planctomycetales bacterium]
PLVDAPTADVGEPETPSFADADVAAPFVPDQGVGEASPFGAQNADSPAAATDNQLAPAFEAAESSAASPYSAPPEYAAELPPSSNDRYASAPVDGPSNPVERPGFPPALQATYSDAWNAAQNQLRQQDLDGALLTLSPWYQHPTLAPEEQQELASLLSQLAGTVIYSTDYHIEPRYVVAEPGEQLEDIAREFNVPVELLARINGVAETAHLPAGHPLKVVRGPFSAVVDVTNKEMVLLLDGRYAGRFDIGVGQERPDLVGEFSVKSKLLNPPYYGQNESVEAGQPDNPLGGHFLGLTDVSGQSVGPIAIHGTNDPANLTSDPRGFIRLSPQDAEHAYYILGRGSSVIIRR